MKKIIIYIIASSIFLILIIAINPAFNAFHSFIIDPSLANNYGSFIGGVLGPILSIISIVLLIESTENQKKEFIDNSFRTHIYELIKYNRETVSSFEYIVSYDPLATQYTGGRFFIYAKKQIEHAIKLLGDIDKNIEPLLKVKIAYLMFYFGSTLECQDPLKSHLLKLISSDFADKIYNNFREIRTRHNNEIQYFGGHQIRLSQYYRQLYFLIDGIDKNGTLSTSQKNEFINLIKVQMSDYEQAILYYHSLSSLGYEWSDSSLRGYSLIVIYGLISNLQNGFIKPPSPTVSYPNINFSQ